MSKPWPHKPSCTEPAQNLRTVLSSAAGSERSLTWGRGLAPQQNPANRPLKAARITVQVTCYSFISSTSLCLAEPELQHKAASGGSWMAPECPTRPNPASQWPVLWEHKAETSAVALNKAGKGSAGPLARRVSHAGTDALLPGPSLGSVHG